MRLFYYSHLFFIKVEKGISLTITVLYEGPPPTLFIPPQTITSMVVESITNLFTQFFGGLSIAEGRLVLEPLILFVIGMVVYSVFVFKFYKFIARRDVFKVSKGGGESAAHKVGYALEYLFLFPLIAFFWFFAIAVLLAMLSKVLTIGNIFMISMAMMATIRVAAYYREELARDISKLIPFALLAVFLLDISSLSIQAPLEVLRELPSVINTLVYYLIFIVLLEFILRIVTHGRSPAKTVKPV